MRSWRHLLIALKLDLIDTMQTIDAVRFGERQDNFVNTKIGILSNAPNAADDDEYVICAGGEAR